MTNTSLVLHTTGVPMCVVHYVDAEPASPTLCITIGLGRYKNFGGGGGDDSIPEDL
jgi:hypothetical protein